MRSMGEGHVRQLPDFEVRTRRGCPSTTLRVVPLPIAARWRGPGYAVSSGGEPGHYACVKTQNHAAGAASGDAR